MSSNIRYEAIYSEVIDILTKYSLAELVADTNVETVHTLMLANKAQLNAVTTFTQGIKLADRILATVTGFPMPVKSFIKDDKDIHKLYIILCTWRCKLFEKMLINSTVPIVHTPLK